MKGDAISYRNLVHLAGQRLGACDVPCPVCGPARRSPANRRRRVLRVWRITPSFATYRCARCDLKGYAREDGAPPPEQRDIDKARAEAQQFAVTAAEIRREKARWVWGQRRPIADTPAERYLRQVRRYGGPIPATIGFLPGYRDHAPAMISAFGLPIELEPGMISIAPAAVMAVHITRLAADGSAKAGTEADKIMIGTPQGVPIALAAINDLMGLAVTEGIEDGLSVHEATGLGAWAAGSAPFLPALVAAVPSWVDFVTVIADPDPDGERFAAQLSARLADRAHRVVVWGARGRTAA